ncbi:MAG: RtcB family protein [Desulfobacteraceae bacterium]|nr:RtcB family protein [Desulfobacteraceae bacterium]
MKTIIDTEKIPIKLWLDDIEEGALQQARNIANFPHAHQHVAIMPDAHQGYGMPIGGVLATRGVIIPNAVGVDIGCGMCAVKTALTEVTREQLKNVMRRIRDQIPLGMTRHKKPQDKSHMPDLPLGPICKREYGNALRQVGTLGGGNHFIELQRGSDGHIWLMIHSGSRNLGYTVASYYNKLAIKDNRKKRDGIPKQWQLAYFKLSSAAGREYLREMEYCVAFALANRRLMMDRLMEIVAETIPGPSGPLSSGDFARMINIAHNYAALEHHFGENVYVHRKGATSARKEEDGIIPGSQGSKSYIVKGLGCKDSFSSCSHGAGRVMSRSRARKVLNLQTEVERLERLGVIHAIRHVRDLDEASSAYKDIDMVMENQKDLVEVVMELTPLAVVKG